MESDYSHIKTSVRIAGKELPFPVLVASGTFGYGEEYKNICNYSMLGGIVCKTLTKNSRMGNPPPRIYELATGALNSIGLANSGMNNFATNILPKSQSYPCPYIVNIAGKSVEEFVEIVDFLQAHNTTDDLDAQNLELNTTGDRSIWGWELNLSCPNVSQGTNFGKDPKLIFKIVKNLRSHTSLPIIVKLPPNVSDIGVLGKAAQDAGADAISAINTFVGMWIDIQEKTPVFARHTGGLSGEAIFPIALALVYELCKQVSIPVIGIGGITHGNHAIQFLLAGASAVQVGSANFRDPTIAPQCMQSILEYCNSNNINDVNALGMSN